jgi:hypothetical protein
MEAAAVEEIRVAADYLAERLQQEKEAEEIRLAYLDMEREDDFVFTTKKVGDYDMEEDYYVPDQYEFEEDEKDRKYQEREDAHRRNQEERHGLTAGLDDDAEILGERRHGRLKLENGHPLAEIPKEVFRPAPEVIGASKQSTPPVSSVGVAEVPHNMPGKLVKLPSGTNLLLKQQVLSSEKSVDVVPLDQESQKSKKKAIPLTSFDVMSADYHSLNETGKAYRNRVGRVEEHNKRLSFTPGLKSLPTYVGELTGKSFGDWNNLVDSTWMHSMQPEKRSKSQKPRQGKFTPEARIPYPKKPDGWKKTATQEEQFEQNRLVLAWAAQQVQMDKLTQERLQTSDLTPEELDLIRRARAEKDSRTTNVMSTSSSVQVTGTPIGAPLPSTTHF